MAACIWIIKSGIEANWTLAEFFVDHRDTGGNVFQDSVPHIVHGDVGQVFNQIVLIDGITLLFPYIFTLEDNRYMSIGCQHPFV